MGNVIIFFKVIFEKINIFVNRIISDKNFEFFNTLSTFEAIILLIAIFTVIVTYYIQIDKKDIPTISLKKFLKYSIICILLLIDLGILIYCAFNPITSLSYKDCIIVNSLKIGIFSAVTLTIIFIIYDQLRIFVNENFHQNINIHP